MGLYDEKVDPFADPGNTRTAVAFEPAVAAPDGHRVEFEADIPTTPAPGLGDGLGDTVVDEGGVPVGRIPDEHRHLFTSKALALLEGATTERAGRDRTPSAPGEDQEPVEYLCGMLEAALERRGGIPAARLIQMRATWPPVVHGLLEGGYTPGQIGDVVLYLTRGAKPDGITGMGPIADQFEQVTQTAGFRTWARSRAVQHWDFPAPKTSRWQATPEVLIVCLRLRERVQTNMDAYVATKTAKTVQIDAGWLTDADKMMRIDGFDVAAVTELVDWATTDQFWRTNVRSMPSLRKYAARFMTDERFLRFRQTAGIMNDPNVVALVTSFRDYVAYVHRQPVGEIPSTWHLGAWRLLQRYTLDDVRDMMKWSMDHAFFRGRVASLLEADAKRVEGWTVADHIRHDGQFVEWSRERGRAWAAGAPRLREGRGDRAVMLGSTTPSAEAHLRVNSL